jgi:hypothetical protein
MTNTNDEGMQRYGNVISLATKPTAKAEPQKLDLRDYAERLAISLGWHVFATDGGIHDNQIITKEPCVTIADRQRVPTLVIGQDWRKGKRISVAGCWPSSEATGGVCSPNGMDGKVEATFSPEKEPSVVARELARRMLPLYLAQYETQMVKVREWEAYRDAGTALAARIQDALGIERRMDYGTEQMVRKDFYAPNANGNVGAHVQVSGETVRIEASGLTEAQALAILAIVKGG